MQFQAYYKPRRSLFIYCKTIEEQQTLYTILRRVPAFDVTKDRMGFYVPLIHYKRLLKEASKEGCSIKLSKICISRAQSLNKIRKKLDNIEAANNPKIPDNPRFNGKLRPFQKRAVLKSLVTFRYWRGILNAFDMGLGKTITSIWLLSYIKPAKTLIIAPSSLTSQWKEEIKKFTSSSYNPKIKIANSTGNKLKCRKNFTDIKHYKKRICEKRNCSCFKLCAKNSTAIKARRANYALEDYGILIIGYELFRTDADWIRRNKFDMIICDESSKIKNYSSIVTKRVLTLDSKYLLLLTGTPIENSIEECWTQFAFIDEQIVGTRNHFIELYCDLDERGNVEDYHNVKIFREAIRHFLIRKSIEDEDVRKQLPKITRTNRIIKLTSKHKKLYDEVHRGTLEELTNKDQKINVAAILAKINYLSQVGDSPELIGKKEQSNKVNELLQILQSEIDSNSKILIFTRYLRMANFLRRDIEKICNRNIYVINGKFNKDEKAEIVNDFIHSSPGSILISTDCISYGHNLQVANYIINFDFPWNPAIVEQRIRRAYRMGQEKPVVAINLIAQGTVEENICRALFKKLKMLNQFIDGRNKLAVNTMNVKALLQMLSNNR